MVEIRPENALFPKRLSSSKIGHWDVTLLFQDSYTSKFDIDTQNDAIFEAVSIHCIQGPSSLVSISQFSGILNGMPKKEHIQDESPIGLKKLAIPNLSTSLIRGQDASC